VKEMELLDIMQRRRSIRKFNDKHIPEDSLKKIIQAGLLAPTSMNRKPCEFYVVKDQETKNKLSKAKKMGASFIAQADCLIVVLADAKKADIWVEDSSIALSYMMLMATNLHVASCWCQMHLRKSALNKNAEENVRKILHVKEDLRCVGLLALGMSDEHLKAKSLEAADYNKVHYEKSSH
jgi:nitroreductase